MDSLSSFGKVRTMEEDEKAARNKPRSSDVPSAPGKDRKIAEEVTRAAIAPIMPVEKKAPAVPPLPPRPGDLSAKTSAPAEPSTKPGLQTPPMPRQLPPMPRQSQPLPPKPPIFAPPVPPKPPLVPSPLRREEKPETAKSLPVREMPTPEKILGTLPPRPFAPPLAAKPVVPPLAPPRVPEIGKAPSRQDLSRFLPVEEEEEKFMPSTGAKKPPFVPSFPEGKTIIPIRPEVAPIGRPAMPALGQHPIAPVTPGMGGATPEEILGINPPAGGPRHAAPPPPPITPRAITPTPPGRPAFPTPPKAPVYESPYEEKRVLPLGLIAGAVMLVIALGGFFVYRATRTSAPQQQPPSNVVVNPPSPFFTPDSTNIITLQKGQEGFLVEQVRALESAPGDAHSITYIPIKKSSDNSFLGTKDFFSAMGISLPAELLSDIDNQFMLYLYTPGTEEQERCATENISNASCYSPRLGVVLKINPGSEAAVQNIMSGLEPTLIDIFRPLLLGSPAYDKATPWDTATYKGLSVRFTNLPISTTSLNWTETGSYLVIATSKNSSYSVLDKLVTSASPLPTP